jgi:hypothetical protein
MSGSHHVEKANTSSDVHRYSSHVTPSVEIYGHAPHISAHDRRKRVVPSSQNTSFVSYKYYNTVQPENAIPTGVWNGSSSYSDYIVPDSTHIINDCTLEFTLQWTSDASSGSGNNIVPKPAHQMIDYISLMFEGSGQDSCILRGEDQQVLYLASTSDEEYRRSAHSYGMDPTDDTRVGVRTFTAATGNSQSFTRKYRIRVGGPLSSSRIFAAGIVDDLRIRVHWATSATTAVTGTPTVSLQSTQLILEEQQLTRGDFDRLMAQYRSDSGVSHRWAEVRVSSHPFTVSSGMSLSQVLNSHSSYAAGLLVTCRSQLTTGAGPTTFLPITSLQLHDERNVKLSNVMSDDFLRDHVSRAGDWASDAARSTPFYFIPFSLSLASLFAHGTSTGGLKLSSRDKLDIVASATMASTNSGNIQIDIGSINPAWMDISRGKVRMAKS